MAARLSFKLSSGTSWVQLGVSLYWSDLLAVLRRRWYLTVPGLVLTLAAGLAVRSETPPAYELSTSLGVLPAATRVVAEEDPAEPRAPVNVIAGIGLVDVAKLLSHTLSSDEAAESLEQQGLTGEYTALPTIDGTPLLILTAEDKSVESARARILALSDLARRQLRALQADVPPDYQLQVWEIVPVSRPLPLWGSVIRAVVAVTGLGLITTVLLAYVVDGILLRRDAIQQSARIGNPDTPQHRAWTSHVASGAADSLPGGAHRPRETAAETAQGSIPVRHTIPRPQGRHLSRAREDLTTAPEPRTRRSGITQAGGRREAARP